MISCITQHEYIVIVKSADAKEFAQALWELEERGCKPQMGQALFYEGGMHVAYYLDPSKVEPLASPRPAVPVAPVASPVAGSRPADVMVGAGEPGGYA